MEELFVLWIMGMATGTAVWVLRSLSRHWERKHQVHGGREIHELTERVAELERRFEATMTLDDRVAEIEERQDFAERLLAQTTRDQIPGAGH